MKFLSKEHQERYDDLMSRGRGVSSTDRERAVVMYIISGNRDLYSKAKSLFDFNEGRFIFDKEETEDGNYNIVWRPLSTSETMLITLAFDLYSSNYNVYVYQLFRCLDSNNRELALNAISYRFN